MTNKWILRKSSQRFIVSSVLIAFYALSTSALAMNNNDRRLVEQCLSNFSNLVNNEARHSRDVQTFRNLNAEYERRRNAYNTSAAMFRRLDAQMRSCVPSVNGVNHCNNLLNQVKAAQPNLANEERWLRNQLRLLTNRAQDLDRHQEQWPREVDRMHDSCRQAWPVDNNIWRSTCPRYNINRSEWLDYFTSYRC